MNAEHITYSMVDDATTTHIIGYVQINIGFNDTHLMMQRSRFQGMENLVDWQGQSFENQDVV